MPRERLEVNALSLPEADTGPFGIADWLAQARATMTSAFGLQIGIAMSPNSRARWTRCVPAQFQEADLPLLFLGDSHCSWLTVLSGKSYGVVIPYMSPGDAANVRPNEQSCQAYMGCGAHVAWRIEAKTKLQSG
jgi:hypothetical protein